MADILDELLAIGFLTGSRAFGTAKLNSDWDVVYSVDDTKAIQNIIRGHTITPSNYFSGYTIDINSGRTDACNSKIINLIPVVPHDFLPWYLATKAMKATLSLSGIDKIQKYAVFQGMVAMFKGTVAQQGLAKGYIKTQRDIRLDIKYSPIET